MKQRIRRALPADAAAIATIAADCFGEPYDSHYIRNILISAGNHTLVAADDERVIGFADNFVTVAADGISRLELDLLGVDPGARGQGVGVALILASLSLAAQLDVGELRCLVALDNKSMNRLCQGCGLSPAPATQQLYVRSADGDLAREIHRHDAHLIAVDTLGYRGIWIEGRISAEAIESALSLAQAQGRDRVGAVFPAADLATRRLLERSGFDLAGAFRWWRFKPGSGRS